MEQSLSLQEVSHLHDKKNALKELHFVYLRQHPELRTILADFTAALLLEKPKKLFSFATEHFASLEPSDSGPPMLTHGPPIFVITGGSKLNLPEMLDQRFPGTFMTPVMTTTRPPHRGERPGITMNFATPEMIEADIRAGKYLETGIITEADSEGELIGTTLDAVVHIKARGAVPLLQVSYERAAAVRSCKLVKPPPRIIFISEGPMPSCQTTESFDAIIHSNEVNVFDELVTVIETHYSNVSA